MDASQVNHKPFSEKNFGESSYERKIRTHEVKPKHVPNGAANSACMKHPFPRSHFDDEAEDWIRNCNAN